MSHSHSSNDWYQELCALAAIGEVSPSEFEELQKHLTECDECSELYADFRRISARDLGLVAAKRGQAKEVQGESFDEEKVLSRLLDRADRERATEPPRPAPPSPVVETSRLRRRGFQALLLFQRPALSYGSLALILCAGAAIGAYRLREAQLTPTLQGLSSELQSWKSQAETTKAKEKSTSESLDRVESDRGALQKSLAQAEGKEAELEAEQRTLQAELTAAQAQVDRQKQDLSAAKTGVAEKDAQLVTLTVQLNEAIERTQQQERIADNLRTELEGAPLAANTPEGQGFNDADAKELFGARDLHIVDVYDVNSSGQTRRTYGRVYYVQKKLLIFYAFDLQDKKHNRAAAGFQAWGYREANQNQPESLGLFDLDDASTNRWVLKVSNPRVLERVDAVYVTLEPPNGSPSPRGRRLLYANLVTPPNHP